MNGEVEFVDTNVIYYAHDRSAGEKRDVARGLLVLLDADGRGALSIQVLQELAATILSKGEGDVPQDEIEGIIDDLSDWTVFSPGPDDVIGALRLRRRFRLSFWDAMIVHAAREVGAAILWSEDLSDGQDYGGVVVRNPFSGKPVVR